MGKRLEIEQKFYFKDIQSFYHLLSKNNFKKIEDNDINDVDEYFTDINSEYIKNRTCLRIRKTNKKSENNISININDYNNLIDMLGSLGFYSYTTVKKSRSVYTKTENNIEYNIMIDTVKNIGAFIEFEILSDESFGIDNLTCKLNELIDNFKSLDLEKAMFPYRDYSAKTIYDKYLKDKKTIIIDFDNILLNKNSTEEITAENINTLTSNYNTIVNLELLKKIKEIRKDKINFELISNINKENILKILNLLNLNNIFSTNILNEDIKKLEKSNNDDKNSLLLTTNTISSITKNLTQILLIYLNNI